ncbi:hypothetical protein [Nonomuraea sp. NPDC048916]|uniref:DUF4190 domain-containing protein n=1 Tax=Nonomuraea sp. NPDC048916 TaxID=3154232 RepID=UPI0033D922C4
MTTPEDPNQPRPPRDEPGRTPGPDDPPSTSRWEEESPDEYLGSGAPGTRSESDEPDEPDEPGEPIQPVPPVVPHPEEPLPEREPPGREPKPGGEPWPGDEPPPGEEPTPPNPDLPTSPEVPGPTQVSAGDEADTQRTAAFDTPAWNRPEETQPYQRPGGRPPYPGWEGAQGHEQGPPRTAPSRYDPPTSPYETHEGGPKEHGPGDAPGERRLPEPGTPSRGEPPETAGPQAGHGTGEPAVPGTTPSSPYGGPPGGGPYGGPPGGGPYGGPPGGGPYGGPPGGGPYGGPPGHGPPAGGPGYVPGPYGYQPSKPGSGLATASLVLGVASPFLVFVCFTGLLTAILSIVFGAVALGKGVGKGRAITGIVVSVLALILFTVVAVWFYNVVQECAQLPGELADRCFENRFPWMKRPR